MAHPIDRKIDPVAEAAEYQRLLLDLVGDRDPAELQAGFGALLSREIEAAGPNLRKRPEPAEWSPLECVGHVVDAEIVYASRYRLILTHDRPTLVGYDQDSWVDGLRHNDADPEELLSIFRPLRKSNLQLWARTTHEDRERVGMHTERGPESLDLSFRIVAGHDVFHLEQMRRPIAAVS